MGICIQYQSGFSCISGQNKCHLEIKSKGLKAGPANYDNGLRLRVGTFLMLVISSSYHTKIISLWPSGPAEVQNNFQFFEISLFFALFCYDFIISWACSRWLSEAPFDCISRIRHASTHLSVSMKWMATGQNRRWSRQYGNTSEQTTCRTQQTSGRLC